MPVNKNATTRYLALDRCFSNPGRKYDITTLVEACNEALLDIDPHASGVKKRQVYDDIRFMIDSKGYDAPIEKYKEGRKTYYRYADSDFSISKQALNEQELQQLRETLTTLSRFQGLPQFEWINDIKARLDDSFTSKSDTKVISFEENPFLTGREHLGTLHNAIINRVVLEIDYQTFKDDHKLHFTIHPYHLKQYNNRWFLFGWNEHRDEISNIPLDRILSIEDSDIRYRSNETIDFNEYFDDAIGVSIPMDQQPRKVLLKIDARLWPYIKTKPFHGSQKVKEVTKEFTIIELELYLNYELESRILSRGRQIEVLAPDELRQSIKSHAEELSEIYQ